jgi:four helix bundle protein
MYNFKELKIWQKSRELTKKIYLITQKFLEEEKYDLISQVRRSAVSIPSNIAEGSGRESKKEFLRFLNISISSAFELETQIIISGDLGFIEEQEYNLIIEEINEIQKMIYGFGKSLEANQST